MSRHTKPGRNDLCECGSGKKRKVCCAAKAASSSWTSRLWLAVVATAVVGGIAAAVLSYGESSSATAMPGKVWSPEHGHFH